MKWFYRMAQSEGEGVVQPGNLRLETCIYEKFCFEALDCYELFSGQTASLLVAAGRGLAAGDLRQTAFQTACAAEILLHPFYGVYHVADTDQHNLTTLYLRVRTISPELLLLSDPENLSAAGC